jgi:hypothetical protein
MVFDSNRGVVVLFGGVTSEFSAAGLADTWEWDGTNWTEVTPTTSPPGRGVHYNMTFDPGRGVAVLMGGGTQPSAPMFNDIWEYDGLTWSDVSGTADFIERAAACASFDGSGTLLFGGGQWDPMFGETYSWNGSTLSLLDPDPAPSARMSAMCDYDSFRNRVTLFAGSESNSDQVFVNDTWDWDGSAWVSKPAGPAEAPNCCRAFAYDQKRREFVYAGQNTWTFGPPD